MSIPRKIRLDLMTPPEVALRAALAAVEGMPADVRLTQASMKVSEALDLVSAYVDEQMRNVTLGNDGTTTSDWKKLAEDYAGKLAASSLVAVGASK